MLAVAFVNCLVHLCCYEKIPWPGKFLKDRNLFLTVLEAGESKIKVPALVSDKDCSLLRRWRLNAVSSDGQRQKGKKLSLKPLLLYKGINPFMRAPPS